MLNPYLSVVEEEKVTAAIEAAVTKYSFAEDVFQAAIWRIERQYECGEVLQGTNPEKRLMMLPPNAVAKSPGLLVRYHRAKDSEGFDVIIVDWVMYLDYDEAIATLPEAYIAK